ncbi:MAG: putative nucleic acid-binding Zn-ribbon protein [Halioglobus sp.]|jgi:predicted  nucleic acid-binding Zn-ribbon protein
MKSDTPLKQNIEEVFEGLKTQRDELQVKVHLANMEVRDEWNELENQWQHLVSKKDRLKKDIAPTLAEAHAAWLLLRDEIAEGYQIIRKKL